MLDVPIVLAHQRRLNFAIGDVIVGWKGKGVIVFVLCGPGG